MWPQIVAGAELNVERALVFVGERMVVARRSERNIRIRTLRMALMLVLCEDSGLWTQETLEKAI